MSGVYIENMTLDEFSDYGDYCQTLIGTGQAIEVPDHGRLIDADKLEAWCDEQAQIEWNKSAGTSWSNAYLEFGGNVYDAPTVIPDDGANPQER